MKTLARVLALVGAISAWPLAAQGPAFDTSGNGLLNGTYYFRQVLYGIDGSGQTTGVPGGIAKAIAVYGNITFDGNGNYSMTNVLVADTDVNNNQRAYVQDPLSCYVAGTICNMNMGAPVPGAYSLSASGFGFISNPIVSANNVSDKIFGALSAGKVFVGSSTEATSAYNDLFIAALVPSPLPTNSFFSGSYTAAGFFPGGTPQTSADAFFPLTANGAGGFSPWTISGYAGNGAQISQSVNPSYSFSGGAAVVTFPVNQNAAFLAGGPSLPEYLYFSQDGNFFFGGSPTGGFDIIAGVRNASGTQNFGGLYYQAGLDQDDSVLSTNGANFDSYYGALNATGSGIILEHQRVSSVFNSGAFNSTFADSFTPPVTGTYTDTPAYVQYAVGGGGAVRIGEGIAPYLGISVALQAPKFSGSGVFLDPSGIVNAASFSPFTAGVSNGEMVTLFGANLAPGTMSAPANTFPLPTNLNGVQVLVNGAPAPLLYVSQGQILMIMPSGNTFNVAQFQVVNSSGSSNVVTELVNPTTPGVFTANFGLGDGFAIDATGGFVISESKPARPGDVVELFVDGLGTVFPTVPDGQSAPSSPLSNTTNTIVVSVGGKSALVSFAGLVPTLAGLYQVNFTVPANASAGDNTLDVSGPDSYASQAVIPIGSGMTASARPAAKLGRRPASTSAQPRSAACFFRCRK